MGLVVTVLPLVLLPAKTLSESQARMPELSSEGVPITPNPGAGEWAAACGEGPEALCPAHQQQGLPADLHPHLGAATQLLHA